MKSSPQPYDYSMQSPVIDAELLEVSEGNHSANHFNFSIDFSARKTLSGRRVISKYQRYDHASISRVNRPAGRRETPKINAVA